MKYIIYKTGYLEHKITNNFFPTNSATLHPELCLHSDLLHLPLALLPVLNFTLDFYNRPGLHMERILGSAIQLGQNQIHVFPNRSHGIS
jgi:hypothetical protein